MRRLPPRVTRTDTRFPYTPLVRSIKVQASVGRHDAVAAAMVLPDPAIPFDGPPTMERHIRKTNDGLPVLELVPRSVDLGIADCQQGAHCGRCQPVLR